MENEAFGTCDGINEGFSIKTEDLERFFFAAKWMFGYPFDFSRKFELVMENDPSRPSTEFKLRYKD